MRNIPGLRAWRLQSLHAPDGSAQQGRLGYRPEVKARHNLKTLPLPSLPPLAIHTR